MSGTLVSFTRIDSLLFHLSGLRWRTTRTRYMQSEEIEQDRKKDGEVS